VIDVPWKVKRPATAAFGEVVVSDMTVSLADG